MNIEKEKQPVEPEAQPLKEEELDEVNGGIFLFSRPQKCEYCGIVLSKLALETHKKTVHSKEV